MRALTVLTPAGDERRFARGDAQFDGAVVHLGALGVVVQVELEIEPAYDVVQYVYDGLDLDVVAERLDEITASATSVSIFTDCGSGRAGQIWTKHRADAGEAPARQLLPQLGAALADGPRHPVPGGDVRASTEQGGAAGSWADRLPHFRLEFTPSNGAELQSEYFVDRADTPAAIEALLRRMEAVLPETTRPHWGKLWQYDPARVTGLFERWDDFAALRAECDPQQRFVNDFLARLGL